MRDKFIFKELGEDEVFDPLSISSAAPFTQSSEYGQWQKDSGREVRRFLIGRREGRSGECDEGRIGENGSGEIFGFFQMIKFELPFRKNFIYSPYGPIIRYASSKLFPELLLELKNYLSSLYGGRDTVFIRLDFSLILEKTAEGFEAFFKKPRKSTYHSAYLQPRTEWYLDILDSEENLLKKMHEKTRYLVNLSARKGIETEIVEKDFKKYFEIFYSLLGETAKRNGFFLHPKKYYENIFDRIEKNAGAFLSVARYENKILVMNFVQKYGETAHFIFGGSSGEHRNLSPSHAAHWAAIVHAKKIGCKSYNFGGVIEDNTAADGAKTNGTEASDTHKGWAGLSSFKKKFGGRIVLHNYCYDLVIKRVWYYLYVSRKTLKGMFQV